MPGTRQSEYVLAAQYEAVVDENDAFDVEAALALQHFNEAIQTLKNYEKKVTEAQQHQSEPEQKITQVPRKLPSAVELIGTLEQLRNKVVKDVNDKVLLADEAKNIAISAKALTEALVDPDLSADKKHQALKKFQQVAWLISEMRVSNVPISKTRIALTMLCGAVIGAAVVLLLVLCPVMLFTGASLAKILAYAPIRILVAVDAVYGGMKGAESAHRWLFSEGKSRKTYVVEEAVVVKKVVEKALVFAPKPGFFNSGVMGLLFQRTSKPQEGPTHVQHNPQPPRVRG